MNDDDDDDNDTDLRAYIRASEESPRQAAEKWLAGL